MTDRIDVAVAVIERPDGAFLMASRPPGKVYAGWWEFPGGKVKPGESLRRALDRELKEELGIKVRRAYPWLTCDHDYAHARVRLHFFRVTAWHGTPHPHEGQALAWVQAKHPTVSPILPANGSILRRLSLPLIYGISAATELGAEVFLHRLESALGKGLKLLQLREKAMPARLLAHLSREVAARCRAHGAQLMINADIELAKRLNAGVHLPSAMLMTLKRRPDLPWVAASCHNARELERAQALGVDFVVLSPVLPTASHPEAQPLGWERFSALAAGRPMPVYALGGLKLADLDSARSAGAHGIAMKTGLWT